MPAPLNAALVAYSRGESVRKIRIEYAIILIVWLLSMVAALGAGYVYGGAWPYFDGTGVTNALTMLIAISNMVSAVVTLATLGFLMLARHDWLKPKISDAAVDLKLSLRKWDRDAQLLFKEISTEAGLYTANIVSANVSHFYDNERQAWSEFERLYDKYEFYHDSDEKRRKAYNDIKSKREKIASMYAQFREPHMRIGYSKQTSIRILQPRLISELSLKVSEFESTIQVRN